LIAIEVVVNEKSSPVFNEKYEDPGLLVVSVFPVNLHIAKLPSSPEDPLVPLVPLVPDVPLDPDDPLVPLVPPEILAVNEENAIWPEVPEVPPV
jgi:hypothetical protein